MAAIVLVDTSAWVAFFAEKDQYHETALEAFEEVGEEGAELATTDFVIAETVTRVRGRAGVEEAARAWESLENGEIVELLDVSRECRAAARRIFRKYRELDLSFVDCVSFAVMNKLGIREALTFDSDFAKAGYVVLPRKRK